ncbi:MAG: hypothetical protein OQJ77_01685 [Thiovulaceae bacterium]|nr:hypothetical protein [Sulfurimonadaceae bacterium]MCW9026002.1 hypothetical protein [Sulfurimonadaceae bacterium]
MEKILRTISAVLAMGIIGFTLSGCGGAKLSPQVQQAFEKKQEMYTQRNMFISTIARFGQKIIDTTNYGNGIVIPVNTKVKLKDVNAKQISFTYNGNLVILRNIPKYSNTTIDQMVKRYFAPNKVNLAKFSKKERDAINNGSVIESRVVVGMSKDAVLVSRGYPPTHATPSIKSDTWKFWEHKFNTTLVQFKDDKVVKITY